MAISTSTPSATSGIEGTVKLTGNLGGTAASPTVTGLTVASQAQGDTLYYNGSAWTRLAAGTSGQVLKTQGAGANPTWTDPLDAYTAIVAPSGGDYTDIATAISTEGNGATIFIRAGTYTLTTGITITQNNITLIGSGEGTIIKAGANNLDLLYASTGTDFKIRNLKVDGVTATYSGVRGIRINAARAEVRNVTVVDCRAQSILLEDNADHSVVKDCIVTGPNDEGIQCSGDDSIIVNNKVYGTTTNLDVCIWLTNCSRVQVANNVLDCNGGLGHYGIEIGGTAEMNQIVCQGNIILGPSTGGIYVWSSHANGTHDVTVTGNTIKNASTHAIKLFRNAFYNVVANNTILNSSQLTDNTYHDIYIFDDGGGTPQYNLIVNNVIRATAATNSAYGINEANTSDHNIIAGNIITGTNNSILVTGTHTQAYENKVDVHYFEKRLTYMKNTSGATVAAGDLVTQKAVAAGNEVTTSTTAGDGNVIGMSVDSISNNAWGWIQTAGKTTVLKVNGTTDIAVGDYIGCFTSAGIGQKATIGDLVTLGHTAIAYALEAYTANDSSGVIDAIIIPPRKL